MEDGRKTRFKTFPSQLTSSREKPNSADTGWDATKTKVESATGDAALNIRTAVCDRPVPWVRHRCNQVQRDLFSPVCQRCLLCRIHTETPTRPTSPMKRRLYSRYATGASPPSENSGRASASEERSAADVANTLMSPSLPPMTGESVLSSRESIVCWLEGCRWPQLLAPERCGGRGQAPQWSLCAFSRTGSVFNHLRRRQPRSFKLQELSRGARTGMHIHHGIHPDAGLNLFKPTALRVGSLCNYGRDIQ